jgi:hypothetical protein
MDENQTGWDTYSARLDFTCPNSNCLGRVKLKDRARPHIVHCHCGLEYGIAADPDMRSGEGRSLIALLGAYDGIIGLVVGAILGIVAGVIVTMRWIK